LEQVNPRKGFRSQSQQKDVAHVHGMKGSGNGSFFNARRFSENCWILAVFESGGTRVSCIFWERHNASGAQFSDQTKTISPIVITSLFRLNNDKIE
jgi:hypothetical protein